MSAAVPVFATTAGYRAAVAELPMGARQTEAARGAVVVVPGEGQWWTALLEAEANGAVAAVVGNPQRVPAEAVATLRGLLSIPVVVERPFARQDDVAAAASARAGSPATLVTIECAAAPGGLASPLRDGLRWATTLAGGPLERIGSGGGMALLKATPPSGHLPVTVLTTRWSQEAAAPMLRVAALGEVRSVVESDAAGQGVRFTTASADGSTTSAVRYEGSARLALRRALEAVAAACPLPDLTELLEDQEILAELLPEHKQG
ncbi:hypothetical protein [Paenarthrobacter sp. NPDC057981]|uniref:hypothetical protein n=1 Tax=Paenarthrobacter sp. NPDC057981 TaxID=3346297 RepID=UPI0036D78007